ncbi:MAG: hypothetical protein U0570_04420 [Phycisphaerales bacterium]
MNKRKFIPISKLADLTEYIRAHSVGPEHLIDSPGFEIRETGSLVETVFAPGEHGPWMRVFWGVVTFFFVVGMVVVCDRMGVPKEMLAIGVLTAICLPPLVVFGLWLANEQHRHLVAAGPYFRIDREARTIELPRSGVVYSFDQVVEVILAGTQFVYGPANDRTARWSEQIGLRVRVDGAEDRIVHIMFNPIVWGKGRTVTKRIAEAVGVPFVVLPQTRAELAKRPWFRKGVHPERTETWEDGTAERWWRGLEAERARDQRANNRT